MQLSDAETNNIHTDTHIKKKSTRIDRASLRRTSCRRDGVADSRHLAAQRELPNTIELTMIYQAGQRHRDRKAADGLQHQNAAFQQPPTGHCTGGFQNQKFKAGEGYQKLNKGKKKWKMDNGQRTMDIQEGYVCLICKKTLSCSKQPQPQPSLLLSFFRSLRKI